MEYTICPKVLERARDNKNYFLDILLPFVQSNAKKVCIDKNGELKKEYKRVISLKPSKDLSSWYDWMSFRESSNFNVVDLETKYNAIEELLLNIANKTYDKKLIVDSRNDFLDFKDFLKENEIILIDRDRAIVDINLGEIEVKGLSRKSRFDISTPQDVYAVVQKTCNLFKKVIEKNGGYKLINKDGGRVHEKILQALYFYISLSFCEANDIKISPECDSGVGPVDFNFSKGFVSNVNVEVKFADNPNLESGYLHQLKAYNEAESTDMSIYLVVKTKGTDDEKVSNLIKMSNSKRDSKYPEVFVVDGKMNVSASKRKK